MSDVIVIGGGIVGSAAAYHLARRGVAVTLVDRQDVGHATAAGAGIIAPGTSLGAPAPYYALSARAVGYYPELIARLAEDGHTATGYETVGALFVATNDDEAARLNDVRRHAEGLRAAGVQGIGHIAPLEPGEAQALFPALARVHGALHLSGSARVDGRLMRASLQASAERHGLKTVRGDATPVRDGSRVTHVEVDGERCGADAVIVAGGAWTPALGERLGLTIPVYPQRGQILHLDLPAVATSRWPIVVGFHSHYLLTFPPHRVVAGATREDAAGYDVRMTAGGVYEALGEALRVAPGLAAATLHEVRIGLRPASPDGLPILGPVPTLDNVYVATGHGPSGLQLGPYSGAAVADLAIGETVDFDVGPFLPGRFRDGGSSEGG